MPDDRLDRSLAAPADVAPRSSTIPAEGDEPGTTTVVPPSETAPTSTERPAGTGATPGATSPRRLALVADAGGDAGPTAPAWADLRSLEVVDTGSGRLELRLDVAAAVPARLASGAVAGFGIDLFTGTGTESDHQVFLEGSDDGWFAYLNTDGRFIPFPGTLRIDGARLTTQIPWGSIDDARQGQVSAFADWAAETAAGLVLSSEDQLPNRARAPYG